MRFVAHVVIAHANQHLEVGLHDGVVQLSGQSDALDGLTDARLVVAKGQHQACHPLQHLCAHGVVLLNERCFVGTFHLVDGQQTVHCALIDSCACIVIGVGSQCPLLVE